MVRITIISTLKRSLRGRNRGVKYGRRKGERVFKKETVSMYYQKDWKMSIGSSVHPLDGVGGVKPDCPMLKDE